MNKTARQSKVLLCRCNPWWGGGGGGGGRIPFSNFRFPKGYRISLVDVYERVGKSVFSVCQKTKQRYKMYFMVVENSTKMSGFVLFRFVLFFSFIFLNYAVPFVSRRYRVPFPSKMVDKRVRGWTSERSLPVKIFFMSTSGPK